MMQKPRDSRNAQEDPPKNWAVRHHDADAKVKNGIQRQFAGNLLHRITTFLAIVGLEVENGVREMRERDRRMARLKLDAEMRPFRTAGKKTNGTDGLLRAMREALGVRLEEISEKTGLGRSTVNDSERREMAQTITMRTLSRMAAGLGCKVVYGVVPLKGKTLEDLAEERLWRKVLGTGNRD